MIRLITSRHGPHLHTGRRPKLVGVMRLEILRVILVGISTQRQGTEGKIWMIRVIIVVRVARVLLQGIKVLRCLTLVVIIVHRVSMLIPIIKRVITLILFLIVMVELEVSGTDIVKFGQYRVGLGLSVLAYTDID